MNSVIKVLVIVNIMVDYEVFFSVIFVCWSVFFRDNERDSGLLDFFVLYLKIKLVFFYLFFFIEFVWNLFGFVFEYLIIFKIELLEGLGFVCKFEWVIFWIRLRVLFLLVLMVLMSWLWCELGMRNFFFLGLLGGCVGKFYVKL